MIYYNHKSSLKQKESFERLMAAFETQAPSKASVFNWFAEFRCGQESLEDKVHSGRPILATMAENIDAVKAMVKEDVRVMVSQMEQELGILLGSVHMILHEKLYLSKVSACWVPYMLRQEQKDMRVQWCHNMLARFD